MLNNEPNKVTRVSRIRQDVIKERDDKIAKRLKSINNSIEIEALKYSLESSEAKKQSCKIRIAVLELRKEQLLR
jgi:hypothetical protein